MNLSVDEEGVAWRGSGGESYGENKGIRKHHREHETT